MKQQIVSYPSSINTITGGIKRNNGCSSPPAPSSSVSALRFSTLSLRSLRSHPDALPASSSAGASLPLGTHLEVIPRLRLAQNVESDHVVLCFAPPFEQKIYLQQTLLYQFKADRDRLTYLGLAPLLIWAYCTI